MKWEILSLFNQVFTFQYDLCQESRPSFQLDQVTTYAFWDIQEKIQKLSLFHWQSHHETFQELNAYVELKLHTRFKSINLIHEYIKILNWSKFQFLHSVLQVNLTLPNFDTFPLQLLFWEHCSFQIIKILTCQQLRIPRSRNFRFQSLLQGLLKLLFH